MLRSGFFHRASLVMLPANYTHPHEESYDPDSIIYSYIYKRINSETKLNPQTATATAAQTQADTLHISTHYRQSTTRQAEEIAQKHPHHTHTASEIPFSLTMTIGIQVNLHRKRQRESVTGNTAAASSFF